MLRSFSKIALLVGGLALGFFLQPMLKPMVSKLLGSFGPKTDTDNNPATQE